MRFYEASLAALGFRQVKEHEAGHFLADETTLPNSQKLRAGVTNRLAAYSQERCLGARRKRTFAEAVRVSRGRTLRDDARREQLHLRRSNADAELERFRGLEDGLRFDASTLVGRRIKEDVDYQCVRLTFVAFLEKARVPMQIDIGFGDVVNPGAEERDYPTLLDFPAPHLRMYPRETVITEKFETMVNLGTLNTRVKDFFDIWLLAGHFDFAGPVLAQAIERPSRTAARSSTPTQSP